VAAGMVSIRVVTRANDAAHVSELAQPVIDEVKRRLGILVVGEEEQTMASVLGDRLRLARQTVATAESCTGGMLGERITSVPGSSDVFLGGVIAYHNDVKVKALGVRAEDIERHGAVSEQVALQMASGIRDRMGADVGVSVTGIAGPGGGTPEKPVGLVWVSVHRTDAEARRFHVGGDRAEIRQRAAQAALEMVRRALSNG